MTRIIFDLLMLGSSLAVIAMTLPEWWLTFGDLRYQRAHR